MRVVGAAQPAQAGHVVCACFQQEQPGTAEVAAPAVAEEAAASKSQSPAFFTPTISVIGLGARGVSSVNKLATSGHLDNAQFLAIDADRKALSSTAANVTCIEVPGGDDVALAPEDLNTICGGAADNMEPGSPLPDGISGAAFVLGSSLGSPGGTTLLLQLVAHLRRHGHFVAAVLTRPFGFEGARKLEQADALIETMETVAHLVVVVDQGVLTRAAADLTMTEASGIADKTLQYTVRSIVWALRSPEVLQVTAGSYLWHGRDLRTMARPLFPPMMSLLTCPGHAHLGRGQASLPAATAQAAGLASMLSTLAEDAAHAAAESPFLDDRLQAATAVLCVLIFPRSAVAGAYALPGAATTRSGGGGGAKSSEPMTPEYAMRSAVQVAAQTVQELAGPRCRDVVVCPQVLEDEDEGALQQQLSTGAGQSSTGGAAASTPMLRVECALLVMSLTPEEAPKEATGAGGGAVASVAARLGGATRGVARPGHAGIARVATAAPAAAKAGTGAAIAAAAAVVVAAQQQPAPGTRLPPAWQAMSMIAGGSAMAAHNLHTQQPPASQGAGGQRRGPMAPSPSGPRAAPQRPVSRGGSALSKGLAKADGAGSRAGPAPAPKPPAPLTALAGAGPGPVPKRSTETQSAAAGMQVPRVPQHLVSALVAQSLDLPPSAARWRHQQREARRAAAASVYELRRASSSDGEDASGAARDGEQGGSIGLVSRLLRAAPLGMAAEDADGPDLKSRVAGMLDNERQLP